MNKNNWLELAEILDAMRVIPRLVLLVTLIFVGWYIVKTSLWYMALSAENRQYTDAGLLSITIPALFGLAGKVFDWYLKTGKKWGNSE